MEADRVCGVYVCHFGCFRAACKSLASFYDLTEASSLLSDPCVLCEMSGDIDSGLSKLALFCMEITNYEVYDVWPDSAVGGQANTVAQGVAHSQQCMGAQCLPLDSSR